MEGSKPDRVFASRTTACLDGSGFSSQVSEILCDGAPMEVVRTWRQDRQKNAKGERVNVVTVDRYVSADGAVFDRLAAEEPKHPKQMAWLHERMAAREAAGG